MAIRRRVLVGTSTNVLGTVLRLVVWLVLTPFILGSLGPVSYGLWVLIGSLAGYGYLLDVGMAPALVKYVAEHVARDDPEGASRVIATSLWLYSGLGIIALALAVIIAPAVPDFFSIPADQRATATTVVLLTGISLAIGLPSTAAPTVLRGLQRYDLLNGISIASTLVSAGATVLVLSLGGGLVGMVATNIPIALLTQAVSIYAIRRIRPDIRFGLRGGERRQVRTIVGYSSSSFLFQLSSRLQLKSDEVVVGRFLPVALVSPYAIGRRLNDFVILAAQQFIGVLLPLVSELHAEGDERRLRAVYVTGTRLAMAISWPLGVTLILLADPFVRAWVGPDLIEAVPVAVILVIASMVGLSQWPAGVIFQGMARHRTLAISALLTGIANVILSVILVQRMGLLGVALGTLIPTTVEALLFVLPYTTRRLGSSVWEVIRHGVIPAGLPLIPSAGVTYVLREAIQPSSLVAVGWIGLVGVATYAVAYLAVGAGPLERDLVRQVRSRVQELLRPPARGGPGVAA